ncbi:MAG TPA: YciI family protein [Puia sp.]|nr:YciI family protein [Puia sp.]
MEKFMLIIREDLDKLGKLNDEERFSNIPMMLKWVDSLIESGNYIKGEPLLIKGRYVSKDQILSDGPFIEAREGVSGYEIIRAENIEQAAAIAQTCPLVQKGLAVREVRPIASIYGVNNE